jgi:hypothetical protein
MNILVKSNLIEKTKHIENFNEWFEDFKDSIICNDVAMFDLSGQWIKMKLEHIYDTTGVFQFCVTYKGYEDLDEPIKECLESYNEILEEYRIPTVKYENGKFVKHDSQLTIRLKDSWSEI